MGWSSSALTATLVSTWSNREKPANFQNQNHVLIGLRPPYLSAGGAVAASPIGVALLPGLTFPRVHLNDLAVFCVCEGLLRPMEALFMKTV